MIAAHINKDEIEQSVQEHCYETADYASLESRSIGLFHTMFLAGLLHDIGKNTEKFNTYIHNAHQGKKTEKKLNHSSAGAKYIIENITTENTEESLTKQLIAYAVMSHHGLNDCLSYDGTDKFSSRLDPDINEYQEALKNSQDILDISRIEKLFELSCCEISSIKKKLSLL